MVSRDSYDSVDDYLESVPDFAKPICLKLREIIRKTLPKADEAIRWGAPCYLDQGLICSFIVDDDHVALSFFRGMEIPLDDAIFSKTKGKNLRTVKFKKMEDIPRGHLRSWLVDASKLNAFGLPPKRPLTTDAPLDMPAELQHALAKHRGARRNFESFPLARRREFTEWIASAKHPETKLRRAQESALLLKDNKNLHGKINPQ
ncbi:MAG: DUF1801 domain-containing protein [Chthoniobacterales bacterium]